MAVRCVGTLACLFTMLISDLRAGDVSKLVVEPNVETHRMGGVNVPNADTRNRSRNQRLVFRCFG